MKDICISCKEVVSITSDDQNQVYIIKPSALEQLDAEKGYWHFSDIIKYELDDIKKLVCLCDNCLNKIK